MLIIKHNSWIYKIHIFSCLFTSGFFTFRNPDYVKDTIKYYDRSIDLCSFFRPILLGIPLVLLVIGIWVYFMTLMVLFILEHAPMTMLYPYIGIITLTVAAIISMLARSGATTAADFLRKKVEKPTKSTSSFFDLIKSYLQAIKDKTCPLMTIEEDAKNED